MSNREKILCCATELFFRNGYQQTSVDDILATCGVAKSNFYYHFKTKEEVAFAALDAKFEEYEALMRCSLSDESAPPSKRIEMFFAGLCEMQKDMYQYSGCPFGNFAAGLADSDCEQSERFRIRLSYFFRRIEGYLHACLLQGVSEGKFRDDVAPLELAQHIIACIQGSLILAKTFRNSQTLKIGLATARKLIERPVQV